jgi:hypothetical protein
MENILEKIDIIEKSSISMYNQFMGGLRMFSLSDIDHKEFMTTFSDNEDLLTINITSPIKRIIKFYNINESIPGHFIELDYNEMTNEQKIILDNFIEQSRMLYNSLAT